MIPLYLRTADFSEPPESLYYLVAAEGMFLVNRNGLFSSVTEVRGVAGLESQKPEVRLHFPRIPRGILEQAYGFFDYVYRKWEGEAVAFLYYSAKHGFHLDVPPQKLFRYKSYRGWRTQGRVEYGSMPRPEGYVKLGDAHSHADTPAFFSGTDDRDDEEDGLRIVMGDLDRSRPSVRVSFVAGGSRFSLNQEDMLENFSVPLPPPAEWTQRVVCRYEGIRKKEARGEGRRPHGSGGWNGQARHP